jgi:hypothetical protein
MRKIDMSAEAVTNRLKLASELRRLCLKLGTAKIKPRDTSGSDTNKTKQPKRTPRHPR